MLFSACISLRSFDVLLHIFFVDHAYIMHTRITGQLFPPGPKSHSNIHNLIKHQLFGVTSKFMRMESIFYIYSKSELNLSLYKHAEKEPFNQQHSIKRLQNEAPDIVLIPCHWMYQ